MLEHKFSKCESLNMQMAAAHELVCQMPRQMTTDCVTYVPAASADCPTLWLRMTYTGHRAQARSEELAPPPNAGQRMQAQAGAEMADIKQQAGSTYTQGQRAIHECDPFQLWDGKE